MEKKRLLFYNGSLRMGGIERVMIDVLQGLDKDKIDITLVIEDGIKELNVFEKDVPKEIKIIYLKPEQLIKKTENYKNKRKKSFYSKIMYNLMMKYEEWIKKKKLKEVAINNYDVIIDFDMGLSKYIDYFKCDKKIAWIHSSIPNWYKRKDRIRRLGNRLKKYDKVVAICDEMKEETAKLYPFLKNKLIRIYNPISFDRILKASEEKINNPLINEKYIISIMRLTEYSKDFDTLIKAWTILKNKNINIKLFILGDGPDREKILGKIRSANLEDRIILLGNIGNPYPWIKNAKLLVHSSKYEGFGVVLVEGLILNKIVISSNCPVGPKEVLKKGKLGYLYDVADYNTLAELIEKNLKCNNIILNKNLIIEINQYEMQQVIREYEKLIFY